MRKLVVLKLDGNLSEGVQVSLEIGKEGLRHEIEGTGWLPPAPSLGEALVQWQSIYRSWSCLFSRIAPGQVLHSEPVLQACSECKKCGTSLSKELNEWLLSEGFRDVREKWVHELMGSDSIRVLIRTPSESLQLLPWHLWDLIENYSNAEVTLGGTEFKQVVSHPPRISSGFARKLVNILAIIGDSTGIDVGADRHLLKNLPGAKVTFLPEPNRQQVNDRLWDQHWDVLFFAGHSQTEGNSGRIYINSTDSLTIGELKNALKKAVKNGLKLAIFNSCDGLGLARELQQLHIPQVIIMREPVPDVVAQEFLKYLLAAFSNGQSLCASLRESREKLQRLEHRYPCATWLPVIFQNPAVDPTTWLELRNQVQEKPSRLDSVREYSDSFLLRNSRFRNLLISSAIATGLVMGARYLGWLETWELRAYDQIQRVRPELPPDNRILIVGITEEDFKIPQESGKPENGSLSDKALVLLLKKLKQNQARVIGLDVYHDFATRPFQITLGGQKFTLGKLMQNLNNLFAVCKTSEQEYNNLGIAPPAEIPTERRTFSDIVEDPNDILRRNLLVMNPVTGSPCQAGLSLSTAVAFYYLEANNPPVYPSNTSTGEYQLRDVILNRLSPHLGVYQKGETWGYQTLINYRSYNKSALNVAPQVSLKQILDPNFGLNEIKDKIILIGVTSPNARDYVGTPYSADEDSSKKIPGVVAQAQMISQILSSVFEQRPLLSFWPTWGDILWVFAWSLGGGFLGLKLRYNMDLILVIIVGGAVIWGFCFCLLEFKGYWVPLVPSMLVFVVTSCGSAVFRTRES